MIRFLFLTLLALISFGCRDNRLPTLQLFIWSDYIKPDLVREFEQKYNCKVSIDTYDSNESMYSKIKLGASGYDILVPSNYYLTIMMQQGMLQPLEHSRLHNLHYLDPAYLAIMGKESLKLGIPYMVSTTGIAYRSDKIPHLEPTWGVFDQKEWRGRMTLLNEVREAMGAALLFQGHSVNTVNPEEIEAATQVVIRWKQNLAKFESEQYKSGLASAEFLVSQAYNGDVAQIEQETPEIDFAYPKEGALLSADYLVIPKDAKQVALAYAFIDFLLEPHVASENIIYTRYLAPNKGAYELLPPEIRQNAILFPTPEQLAKLELIRYLGPANRLYAKAWDKIKTAD